MKKLQGRISALIKAEWKKGSKYELDFSEDLFAGSGTDKWSPDVIIFGIDGHHIGKDGQWAVDPFAEEDVPADFTPPRQVMSFAKRISVMSGVKVRVHRVDSRELEEWKDCLTVEDIKRFCPQAEIIKNGIVEYKGWEIADTFAICKVGADWIIAYSKGGHSSYFSDVIKNPTKKQLVEFFNYIEQDQDNRLIRAELFKKILEDK